MRFLLGGIAGVLAVVWVGFSIFANNFRRSFGASPNALWKGVLPLVVMLLVVIATLLPQNRLLLHLTSAAMAATAIGCVLILRQAPVLATLGLLYCGVWFYWAARRLGG